MAFIEFPIDLQSKEVDFEIINDMSNYEVDSDIGLELDLKELTNVFKESSRISFLIGGGCSKETSEKNNFIL